MKVNASFRILLRVLAVLLAIHICSFAFGQVNTGAISGIVTDSSGSPVEGATVSVTNQATSVTQTRETDSRGFYSVEGLLTSSYTIQTEKTGFDRQTLLSVSLAPGQHRESDITLSVGHVESQIKVEANPVAINTETSENGGTISSEEIKDLQMNGRNFQTLAISIPGVASTQAANQTIGAGTYLIVNGASDEYSTYTIDGVYDMNSGSLGQVNVTPIVDGIAEFSVLKDNYSARYSFAGSGQVVTETKSGTRDFHGSAWDYARNNTFDASNYFSTQSQHLRQNIYGYTFGGPLFIPRHYNQDRKKTFFFAAQQWYNINSGQVIRGAVFPEALRQGDFSASPTRSAPLSLDVNSVALLASEGKYNCITGPTTINPACFNPVSVSLMNAFWPLPNNPGAGFLNYINQENATTREFDSQFRVDHYITPNEVLMGRLLYQRVTDFSPDYGSNPAPVLQTNNYTPALNAVVRLSSTITPTFLNAFSLGETYDKPRINIYGGKLPAGVSIQQSFPGADTQDRIPDISLAGGWAGNGVDSFPITASDGEGIVEDDVDWTKGRHLIQFGEVYMFGIKRQNVFTLPEGSFYFSGVHTGDPAADYLLGLDATYSQASSQRLGNFHYRQGEAYLQDDWKAQPNLTINMGLHWTYFSNDTVSGSQVTSFDPALYNPSEAPLVNPNGSLVVDANNQPLTAGGAVANTLNGIIYAGRDGISNGFFSTSKTLFQPRVGFAYDVAGRGRTSIRGGYGIGYTRVPLQAIYDAYGQNPPYNASSNILNSLISNGTAGTAAAPTTQTLNPVPLHFSPPQIQSFSLSLQQQLSAPLIAEVAYAGSLGRHLETIGGDAYDINFPLPVSTPTAAACLRTGQAPSARYDFDPCINANVTSADYTRPYQGYSGMGSVYSEGVSNYNALQSSLVYRKSGVLVRLAYTYSKALTDVAPHSAGANYAVGTGFQNPRDVAAEYGPPAYDFTHVATATWIYPVPSLSKSNALERAVLGGWTSAGLFLFQSGFALSPSMATDTNGLASRPDKVSRLSMPRTLGEWFSTSSFAAPAFGFFGDAANGTIRGPGQITLNTSLYKTFPLFRQLNGQLRAEAFNVANHPNFSGVDTGVGSATYGQVNSATDSRILEFAFKLIY